MIVSLLSFSSMLFYIIAYYYCTCKQNNDLIIFLWHSIIYKWFILLQRKTIIMFQWSLHITKVELLFHFSLVINNAIICLSHEYMFIAKFNIDFNVICKQLMIKWTIYTSIVLVIRLSTTSHSERQVWSSFDWLLTVQLNHFIQIMTIEYYNMVFTGDFGVV